MRRLVKYIVETDCDGLKDSLKKVEMGAKVGLIVDFNNSTYEFILNMKKNSDAVICFASGIDVSKRQSVSLEEMSSNSNISTIHYRNPSKSIYGVESDDYFLDGLKNMIVQMADFFGFAFENIIFYGSGLGAFESMMLAGMLEGSRAFADGPFLDTLNYSDFPEEILDMIYKGYSDGEISNLNRWHDDVDGKLQQKHFDRMKGEFIRRCGDEMLLDDFSHNFADEYRMVLDTALECDVYSEFDLRLEHKLLLCLNNELKTKVAWQSHKNGQIRERCRDVENQIEILKEENENLLSLNEQLSEKINKLS